MCCYYNFPFHPPTFVSQFIVEPRAEMADSSGSESDGAPSTPPAVAVASESPPSMTQPECWICCRSSSTASNPIISEVCQCSGSIGSVHQECIDQWVLAEGNPQCQSCGATYKVVHSPYPDGVEFPQTLFDEVGFIFSHLILSALGKVIEIISCVSFRYMVLPIIVGSVFYWDRADALRCFVDGNYLPFPLNETKLIDGSHPSPLQLELHVLFDVLLFGSLYFCVARWLIYAWGEWSAYLQTTAASGPYNEGVTALASSGSDESARATPRRSPDRDGEREIAASERDDTSDDESDSSDADEDAPSDSNATPVDELFSTLNRLKKGVAGGGIVNMWGSATPELIVGVVLALFLRSFYGRILLFIGCVVGSIVWRVRYPPKKVQDNSRCFTEIVGRLHEITPRDVKLLFVTFVAESAALSCFFPITIGMVLHYAVSPYVLATPAASIVEFVAHLSFFRLVLYWVVGTMGVCILLQFEFNVMVPLFAPGVDFFFARSTDMRPIMEGPYWLFVLIRAFDYDPLRVVKVTLYVMLIDLPVFFLFARVPIWSVMGVRYAVWGDQLWSSGSLSAGFPVEVRRGLSATETVEEWQLREAMHVMSQWVVQPLLELEVRRNGSALVAAAATGDITQSPFINTDGTIRMLTSEELGEEPWELLWENLSAPSALLFSLINGKTASEVEATTPAFKEVMENLRLPLGWLQAVTVAGGICPLLAASTAGSLLANSADSFRNQVVSMDAISPAYANSPHRRRASKASLEASLQVVHMNMIEHANLLENSTSGFVFLLLPPDLRYDDTVGCLSLFLIAIEQHLPGWHLLQAPLRWMGQLSLRYAYFLCFLQNIVYVFWALTVIICVSIFPIQRAQLRVLLPLMLWLGSAFGMREFLFDEDRLEMVKEFIASRDLPELVMPVVSEDVMLSRRHRQLPPSQLPSRLTLRLFALALVFFIVELVLVWTLPVLLASVLLSLTTAVAPVILGAAVGTFFFMNPKQLSIFFGYSILFFLLFLLGFVELGVLAQRFLLRFKVERRELVKWTFERYYKVQRMVGRYAAI